VAFTVPALRGEFAVTRNIVEKVHKAAAEWSGVIERLRANPSLLGSTLSGEAVIDGCVAFPSVPFYTDAQWRYSVFDLLPYLLSVAELASLLGQPTFLDHVQEVDA
jgi:hypothetical protein